MDPIGMREAKAKFSAIISAAGNGERTIVTNHGRPVAMIAPCEEEGRKECAIRSNLPPFEQALLSLPDGLEF